MNGGKERQIWHTERVKSKRERRTNDHETETIIKLPCLTGGLHGWVSDKELVLFAFAGSLNLKKE